MKGLKGHGFCRLLCIPPLENHLFSPFVRLKVGLFGLLLCVRVLDIFWISPR